MVFEKALSMARNIGQQENRKIENFNVIVNDIQKGEWEDLPMNVKKEREKIIDSSLPED